jgi:ZIP family zinc transporter
MSIFNQFPSDIISFTLALTAGEILAMLVDTMIREVFTGNHDIAGLITVLGFILSFVLSKVG